MKSMLIVMEKRKNILIIFLTGAMWHVSVPEFEEIMIKMINEEANKIIIDLKKLEYISSAGISVLISINNIFKEKKGELFLTGLSAFVKQTLELSQLLYKFNISESVEEALGRIKKCDAL